MKIYRIDGFQEYIFVVGEYWVVVDRQEEQKTKQSRRINFTVSRVVHSACL